MSHWPWQTILTAAALGLTTLGILWRGYRTLKAQNEHQLRDNRRIKREVLGEDDDNPDGPKGPTVREMLGQVIDQTRPLTATVEEHSRRLGKVETAVTNLDTRLTAVETVVIQNLGGTNRSEPLN